MIEAMRNGLDPVVERKFKNLRKRLDQLGFRQPLGIESVPLVERLFSDLVHTTESLKNFKTSVATQDESGGGDGGGGPGNGGHGDRKMESFVEAYRADNAKLVKEVNQLHLELVRRKDVMDAEVKKVKSMLRKIEHENADLRFLNTQYAHKIRVQESEGATKDERIQRLLEKNLEAVVETADGGKHRIATRKQRMQIKSFAPPSTASHAGGAHSEPQPTQRQYDLLKMADTRVQQLEAECRGLKDDKIAVSTQLKTLQAQVQRREDEIERLGRLLEGGRPAASIRADGETKREERRLAQLANQVDFLQQTNKALEGELSSSTAENEELALKVAELQSKNAAVVRELEEFDRLSRELQQEKVAAQSESQRELRKERELLRRQKTQMQKRLTEAEAFKNERLKLVGENRHLVTVLARSEREVERLQAELDRAHEDSRFNSQAGRDTQDPQLQQKYEALDAANRDLQSLYRNVEREREFFKTEYEKFSKISPTKSVPLPDLSREPTGATEAQRFQQEVLLLSRTVQRLELQLADAHANVEALEGERESLLRNLSAKPPKPGARSHAMQNHQELQLLEVENNRLRTELVHIRDYSSRCATDLDTIVRDTTAKQKKAEQRAERAEALLEQVQLAHSHSRRTIPIEPQSRRDDERHDIGSQDGRLHVDQGEEVQSSQLRGLPLSVTDLHATLQELDAERDTLQADLDDQVEAYRDLQRRFDDECLTRQEKEEVVSHLREAIGDMQNTLDGRANELASLRRQLDSKSEEIAKLSDSHRKADYSISKLNTDLDNMTRENQTLHNELAEAQDQLTENEIHLRELSEKAAHTERMLELKEKDRADLKAMYQSLSTEATTLESHASSAVEANEAVREQLATETHRTRSLQAEVQVLSLEVVDGQDRLKELEVRNGELLAELQTAEQREHDTKQELDDTKREVEATRGLAEIAANARDIAQTRVEALEAQVLDLRRQAEGSGQEAAARAQQVDAAHYEAVDLQSQLEEIRTDFCEKEGELDRTTAENRALKRSVDELMSRIEALSAQVQVLHTQKVDADERADKLEKDLTDARFQAATQTRATHTHLADSGLAQSHRPDGQN